MPSPRLFLLTYVILGLVQVANAQIAGITPNNFKNAVEVKTSSRNHFDQNGFSTWRYYRGELAPRMNVIYWRQIKNKSKWGIEIDQHANDYFSNIQGRVYDRITICYNALFSRTVFNRVGSNIQVVGGISHRRGYETIFLSRYFVSVNVLLRSLRDFGSILGLRLEQNLSKRFFLVAQTDHTYYAFVWHKDSVYEFDKGSTRHLFRAHAGLGFRF